MAIKAITSSVAFTDSEGNILANGNLILQLNTPATATGSGGGQVGTIPITYPLDNTGRIATIPAIWANDQLNPTNTFYIARAYNANGLLVFGPVNWTIAGASPIDVSTIVP